MARKPDRPAAKTQLRIHEVAPGGRGVGRHDGEVWFVPFTIEAELVEVAAVERHRRFTVGKAIAILQESPHRRLSPCPYYGECGGCDYQHISYAHQLELKRQQIISVLRRIGRFSDVPVALVQASPQEYGFRNRITVHGGENAIGFYAKSSRQVVDIARCALASETVNKRLHALRQQGLSPGRHATLREEAEHLTFSQTNSGVADLMLQQVRELAQGPVVVDAYCGSGFFAHALAPNLARVLGIDWNEAAIAAARRTAGANEVYVCGDVSELLPKTLAEQRPDTLILDPSAEGLSEKVSVGIVREGPPRLIYISCNPATFARDARRLSAQYSLAEVRPFDMFPQTAEIELLGSFTRQNP